MTLPVQLQLLQPSDVVDFNYSGIDAAISDSAQVLCTGSPTADVVKTFPHTVEGATFDGTDECRRSGDLIGNVDGKQGTISGWFNASSTFGDRRIFSNTKSFNF